MRIRGSFFVLSSLILVPAFAGDGPLLLSKSTRPNALDTARASIRVDVNMALVPVTVLDPMGRNVMGLTPENFRVYEGAQAQPIVTFGLQDGPVSVGLVFDCSRSMVEKFRTAREAPAELYRQLNDADESFLITVSDRPLIRQPFTNNFADLQNALMFTHPNGTTALLDGVYMGLNELKKAHNERKALIVVSDGGDNNSRYTLNELAAMASEADVQIFVICMFEKPQTREELDGPGLLEKLARASGGIQYMISGVNQLKATMEHVGVTLHNQYVLGYYPPQDSQEGKYRKIKVELLLPKGLPRMKIFARSGYFVPGNH